MNEGGVSWDDVGRVLLLQDYNTRLVVLATMLLGVASGLVGSFLLLRKRSLMGDTLSHATLPGIALAFLTLVKLGGEGKSLPVLLLGAALTGVAGFVSVLFIRNFTRLKDDAAMGIVLSVFFGAGVALLGLVQAEPQGSAAGLESFIYGKTASMVGQDFALLVGVALLAGMVALGLFKELRLLCFDEGYAAAQGWPVHGLEVLMLLLVTAVVVAGLQAVGLILVIAFLIIPAAAARMWTERLSWMLVLAACLGATSGWLGASVSALLPNVPAGAVIVLVAASIFGVSLFVGPQRGVFVRAVRQARLKRRIGQQHLLRALYEVLEQESQNDRVVTWDALLAKRSWGRQELERLVQRAYEKVLVEALSDEGVRLTEAGWREAARVTRNHRLWEMYLIRYADIAPSHVDRDADTVEHILGQALTRELEALVPGLSRGEVPESPHPITG